MPLDVYAGRDPSGTRNDRAMCRLPALGAASRRNAAVRAVRDLTGVRGVTNSIIVQPLVKIMDVRDKIEAAFKRSAEIDARRITVSADNGKVTLMGNVRSWAERHEAERAAWAAPGVRQVEDRLSVTP